MTGDQQDILARLRIVLPARWFPDSAPVLDALLNGLAFGWSWVYQQFQDVKAQTRIATATDIWLDIIALDFFGDRLIRRAAQSDAAFLSKSSVNYSGNAGHAVQLSRSCRISRDARRLCLNLPGRAIRVGTLRWEASEVVLATASPEDGAVSHCHFSASSRPTGRSAVALPRSVVGVDQWVATEAGRSNTPASKWCRAK